MIVDIIVAFIFCLLAFYVLLHMYKKIKKLDDDRVRDRLIAIAYGIAAITLGVMFLAFAISLGESSDIVMLLYIIPSACFFMIGITPFLSIWEHGREKRREEDERRLENEQHVHVYHHNDDPRYRSRSPSIWDRDDDHRNYSEPRSRRRPREDQNIWESMEKQLGEQERRLTKRRR